MKLKERISFTVAAGLVVATLILVVDIELRVNNATTNHLVPSHGRVKLGGQQNTAAPVFRRRALHKSINGSRENTENPNKSKGGNKTSLHEATGDSSTDDGKGKKGQEEVVRSSTTTSETAGVEEVEDNFEDLFQVLRTTYQKQTVLQRLGKKKKNLRSSNPTLVEMLGLKASELLRPTRSKRKGRRASNRRNSVPSTTSRTHNLTSWDNFHLGIRRWELYSENKSAIDQLLTEMSTLPIVHITQKEGGTQLKLIIDYSNGGQALFKPMRFPREQQTLPNHFYFTDFERHNAEIAAFHLDKVLGFRRAPPVVGRLLNMTTELYALADGDLLKTFFVSPANNLCFHGHCSYYCDTSHAICGSPDMLEGSFAAFLPPKEVAARKVWRHPWRRSYHKRRKAQWELDENYCEIVRELEPYNEGPRLLDLIDMAVLDFLMGNMDRHHYETFRAFGNNTFPLHLDHGRGFGRPFHDELSILAPIYQCCVMRHSSLTRLLKYHRGSPKLSEALVKSMSQDPLVPILWQPHLEALDRRVRLILQVLRECVNRVGHPERVVVIEVT